jgi:hypothetical protein
MQKPAFLLFRTTQQPSFFQIFYMSLYRLLRSNKESGPFSTEDLIAIGFKPYDLIWVEGKSAGWRYASELPEFAGHAPVVEEQPYDRFYKKNTSAKAATLNTITSTPISEKIPVTPLIDSEKKPEILIPAPDDIPKVQTKDYTAPAVKEFKESAVVFSKKVHVVFPSGNTNTPSQADKKNKPVAVFISATPPPAIFEKEHPSNTEKDLDKKSFSPFYDVDTTPGRHQVYTPVIENKNRSHSFMLAGAFAIGIGTLLGLGLMIGLSIKDEKNNKEQPAYAGSAFINKTTLPVSDKQTIGKQAELENHINPADVSVSNELSEKYIDSRKNIQVIPKSTVPQAKDLKINAVVKSPVSKENKDAESRRDIQLIDKAENLIEVTTNTYSVGAFGGISNLQCILVNNSTVSFETVEVSVEYLQANKKVYKREIIYFKDVRAGQQLVINAPKSSRGIKVVSKIVKATTTPPTYTTIKS